MKYLSANEARKQLFNLIDKVAENHTPTIIKGKRNTAVLLSAEDWETIQESLLVASNKKLSNSLLKGKNTPYEQCSSELE